MTVTVSDDFKNYPGQLDSPATLGVNMVANDTNFLPFITRGIYVGGAGDIYVTLADAPSTPVLFVQVPQGTILPIRAVKLLVGTSASNLIALR